MRHEGSCHCGAIRLLFETARPLAPRACQCSFCRKHGARTVTDPEGRAILSFRSAPILYRFGTRGASYMLCPVCGAYAGALTGEESERVATLNLNLFDDTRRDLAAEPVSYEGESAAQRAERRRARWTPLLIDEGG